MELVASRPPRRSPVLRQRPRSGQIPDSDGRAATRAAASDPRRRIAEITRRSRWLGPVARRLLLTGQNPLLERAMSTSFRVRCGSSVLSVLLVVAVVGSCGPVSPAPPDAAPRSTVPTGPAGRFAITSTFDLTVPAAAAPVIA